MVLAERSLTILDVSNLFCDVEISSCVIILSIITYEPFPVYLVVASCGDLQCLICCLFTNYSMRYCNKFSLDAIAAMYCVELLLKMINILVT